MGRDGLVSVGYGDERFGTDKGFIGFAAEKARGRKVHLDAAKVMKPCSELNRNVMGGL